jgi:hypothetical protein
LFLPLHTVSVVSIRSLFPTKLEKPCPIIDMGHKEKVKRIATILLFITYFKLSNMAQQINNTINLFLYSS